MTASQGRAENGQLRGDRLLLAVLVLALAGLVSYFLKSQEVFPSASIDLSVPRSRIAAAAERWASESRFAAAGAIKSTVFSFDDSTKTFLEYELGLSAANTLMKEEIPVWYWTTRMCRPFQLEEFSASLSPRGKLVSFEHTLENDRKLDSISHDRARELAVSFVQSQAGLPLAGYKLVEDGSVSQLRRTDHYFTWEDTRKDYKGARMRIHTYVAGDRLTAFNQFLYIPETWLRKFSELRSYNKALGEAASIFYVMFSTASFFTFIWVFASGLLRWRFSLTTAILVGAIDLLQHLNSIPQALFSYATTMSYNGYILDYCLSGLQNSLRQTLITLVLVGAAEGIYRRAYPEKIALEKVPSVSGITARQTLTGLVAGHGMFAVHLGWVVAFYLWGRHFGVWSPLAVRNTEGLSSIAPFFSAVYIGTTAAVMEELLYRVLGMAIFQGLTRNFWLANFLQAAAWAFMHSNYAQEPPYARGLELTVVGMFYGFMLRRYGLLACIVSHYVFDAWLSVAPLWSSSQPALVAGALCAVLPFLALTLLALVLKGGRKALPDESTLNNSAIESGRREEKSDGGERHAPLDYQPLAARTRLFLLAAIVVSAVIQFGLFFPLAGGEGRLTISREAARAIARKHLQDMGLAVDGRQHVAWLTRGLDAEALQYIHEKAGFRKACQLAASPSYPLLWLVRFFRPLDPEEHLVALSADGRVVSANTIKAEEAPGASLTRQEASARVDSYLHAAHSEMVPYKFDDAQEQRRKNRVDWTFVYNVPKFKVAQADYKIESSLIGDLLSDYSQGWALPSSWLFERSRVTVKDQVAGYVVIIIGLAMFVSLGWWALGVARSGAVRFRPAILIGLSAAALVLPQSLNDLPEFYVGYGTDTSPLSYLVAQCVRQVTVAISSMTVAAALAAFGLGALRIIQPRLSPLGILEQSLLTAPDGSGRLRREIWIDAVLVGFAAGLGFHAHSVIYSYLHAVFSPVVSLAPLESFCRLANLLSPAADGIIDALSCSFSFAMGSAIVVGLYAKYLRTYRAYMLFVLAFSLLYSVNERYWQDYLLGASSTFIICALAWVLVSRLARFNLLAYCMVGWSGVIAGVMRVLLSHGMPFYIHDLGILTAALLLPVGYLLYLCRQRGSGSSA